MHLTPPIGSGSGADFSFLILSWRRLVRVADKPPGGQVNAEASRRMYPELVPVRVALFKARLPPSEPKSQPLYETERGNPAAQLDNVHSVLRLNYETLRGWISLASPSVAKLTRFETGRSVCPSKLTVLVITK